MNVYLIGAKNPETARQIRAQRAHNPDFVVKGFLDNDPSKHGSQFLGYPVLGSVEIVADRGIHRKVGDETWQAICRGMEAAFRERRFTDGAVDGIDAINALLAQHFPRTSTGPNELPDQPVML